MKNIVQLYFDNAKTVPFIVVRNSWTDDYGLMVTEVKPKRGSRGAWFGDVQGFALPPLNGEDPNPYWGLPGEPQEVHCSGCYQWWLVPWDLAPDEWKAHAPK